MASLKANTRTKTIIYWVVIIVLAALWIGFLAAFIKEKNKNNDATPPPNTTPSPTKPPLTNDDLRLDDSTVPYHYQLRIRSDPRLNYFNGSVVIDLTVQEDGVNKFRLHCNNLNIEKFTVNSADGSKLNIKDVQLDSERQTCIFPLTSTVGKGNYSLSVDFSAEFKEGQITGFYRSSYVTVDNQVRYLTATKFEPTYARMAFPCFDEPKFKASFEVILEHPSSLIALSNEIELETNPIEDGAMSRTTFRKTVPMSTYLVAYVISDFDFSETRTTTGLRVRVYSRPDQVKKTRYAVNAAAQILRYYETYTGINYKLHKLDLIGLPEFVSGAMENWGLVTYKETYILYSESESSAADMRQIAGVIAHELAHMWFGNLVTLEWWSDLWLNEGFASFIEYYGQDYLNKSWNMWDRFLTSDLHGAIRADSLQSAHSLVNTDVLSPSQITAMFNTISYSKGAAILYMIENFIGKTTFQECAKRYLQENEFKITNSKKMLSYFKDAITEATGIDGETFMNKWIYTNGFPILNVERVLNSKKNKSKRHTVKTQQLKVTQTTYTSDQTAPSEPWQIYVTYQTSSKKGHFVASQQSQQVFLEDIEPNQWFKINNGGRDYYIVNYSPADRKLLTQQLKSNPQTFSVTDRANLLFDSYRLADISMLPYEALLDLFDYLKSETHYLSWSVAQSAISSLNSKLRNANGNTALLYKQYTRDLVSKVYDTRVNINADANQLSFEDLMLQNTIISLACYAEYEKCITQCSELFRRWVDQGVEVNTNIRPYVYKYGLQASSKETDWLRLWDLYQSEKDALEKSKLMSALTSTKSSTLLAQLISYSTNQSIINNENFYSVQQSIAANSEIGRSLIWEYIKNNWDALVDRFGLEDRRLGNYVKSVVSGFGTDTRLQDVEEFFARYPNAGAGEGARKEALETIRTNIKWIVENEKNIESSLVERDPISRPWLDWRLDESVRPVHYDVNLTVLVDEETFSGSVRVQVDVQRPIRNLILHSLNLNITRSEVFTQTSGTKVSSDSQSSFLYKANQFAVIPMDEIILPGAYVAELDFTGVLSKTLSGLYLSQYNTNNGETVKLATTQFEAGYARKAFPCFDEPQYKATFTLEVSHKPKFSAISNMPVDYVRQGTELKTTVFQKSVKMSTYLVALVVSDFVSKSSSRAANFSVYTYNKDINLAKTDYALDVGPRILNFYAKDYFKIGYPLPKMDMISIPDFSMGAMENWGLVTYRDVYLLYDEKETSSSSKMGICSIIAHELAHMWYGNLVTIKWWDELWLNEGFAQFMMYKSTAAVEPTWNYEEHFANKELSRVFETDSSLSTHSILTVVNDENDIQSVFDPVTYAKGASIIRMLENTLGEENFRAGVTNYLNKNLYRNTITADLWNELTNVASDRLDTAQMMDSWVTKEGFPVVTVTYRNGTYSLKQQRFLKDSSTSNATYTWFIPVTYRVIDTKISDLNLEPQYVYFNSKEMEQKIEVGTGQVVKFNVDQKGVYIVNYEKDQWKEWASLLNDSTSLAWKKLSVLDRNSLLNDAFYLARSGRLAYSYALNLAEFLKNERSLVVWRTAAEHLAYLRPFLISEDKGVAFNQWIITKLIDKLYDELSWDAKKEDDLNKRQLRALILSLACQSNLKSCKESAAKKFDQWMNGSFEADPDTLSIFLYYTMASTNDTQFFNYIFEQYNSAQSTSLKMVFLNALSAVRDTELLQQLIAKSLDTAFIRSQDFFTFLYYLAQNPDGLELAWKFYRENYATLVDRYGLDESNLGRAIYRFAVYFNKKSKLQEVNDFYRQYPEAGAGAMYRQQALELIQANIAWSKNYYSSVIEQITTKGCTEIICPWNIYRLNNAVQPNKYDLTIQVNTETFQYNGTVKTYVSITDNVDHIIMHAADILDVFSPKVYKNPSFELSTGSGFRYPPLEFYVIPLSGPMKGDFVVETSFNGSLLLGGTVGLYRGWYKQNNKTINLAATQLESTHARKVFPCFDEPHFKQKIEITVVHEATRPTTLSNMNVKSTGDRPGLPGWKETKFNETESMVTYLIAILVSDFNCTSKELAGIGPSDSLLIQTCSSPLFEARKHQYSLSATEKILAYYEKKLAMKYKFPKLDQIALPQFSPGAMENWGLVKYREKMLLWSEDEDTAAEQRSVCAVIAHELAHMWFGNLITCDFWGDLWLNEAFASYMEYGAVNASEPSWKYWDMFIYYDTFNALIGDSSESSQPIVRNVTTPALMSYSSSIVYNKGAAILNMFNNVMGEDSFYKALQSYLGKYQFQTAITDNLFDEFNEEWPHADKVDAKKFMNSWTRQAGFPYLNISLDTSTNTYKYTQNRFVYNAAKYTKEIDYVIPYQYYTSTSNSLMKSEIEFLTEKSGTLKSIGFKVNPNFNGFYLVNYPESEWDRIIKDLEENKNGIVDLLGVNDRAELIISAYLLARAKLTPYLTPFKLFNYLVHEKHFSPWYFYQYTINYLAKSIDRTEYRESLQRFERRIVSQQYRGIEMWNDSLGNSIDKSFRQLVIRLACRSGNVQCLKDAYQVFSEFKANPTQKLPPNLRTNILYYGIRASKSEEDYQFIWERYLSENSTLKSAYLLTLSFIQDTNIMKSYIERSLDENLVSASDFASLFKAVIDDYEHEKMTWDFFTENYSMLSRKLSQSTMNDILLKFAGYATTSKRRQEIDSFLNSQVGVGVTQSIRSEVLDTIDKKLKWMNKYKTEVGTWLAENACGKQPCPWSELRIDSSLIVPTRYDLLIQVNLTTNSYNGSVDIGVQAKKNFQYIVLHANDMLTTSLFQVTTQLGDVVSSVVMFRYRPLNYVVIEFDNEQPVGNYTLRFNFTANLLDAGLSGLYISNYTDGDQQYKIASTQFEFYDARKVFPCFDEPTFKTNFAVSIIHEAAMTTTLSNMEIEQSVPLSGTSWIETKFKESVKMTTYLVAMLVSDFVCKNETMGPIKYGVCASRVQQHKMDYALEVAPKCLNHLQTKLGIEYPLSKVDLVAIPDFYYGAMENWGLITFRESALLYNEKDTTSATKMSVLSVIAHEIAHFWFGDLVTCKWWDNLWLNEAFATFMQYTTMNAVEPNWKIFDLFLMNDFETAVTTDSVDSVHPIIRSISTTKDIDSFNSNVIYSKGATVVRMIQFIMGEDNFYQALHEYLKQYQYQNTEAANLIEFFDKHFTGSDQTIKDITKEWLEKKGFPYLNVTKEGDGYKVEQARFLLQPANSESDTVWKVPVSFYTEKTFTNNTIKYLTEKSAIISDLASKELFKLNVGHNGFYLVNYPSELWQNWAKYLANPSEIPLPVSDRAGLILDSFYLARANLLSYTTPLSLSRYLANNEKEIAPWTIAIRGFSSIRKYVLQGSKYGNQFQEHLRGLTESIYKELGWEEKPEEETDVKRRLRATILDFSCSNQHSECLSNSQKLFTQWIEAKKANIDPNISPNLLSIVLKYGLKEDINTDNWYYVWSQYLNESSVTLKQMYINALANTRDQKSLTMLLNQALEAKVIRSQDVYSVFVAVINSNDPINLQTLWSFYQTNYERLAGSSSPLRAAYLSSLLNGIASQYFFTETRKTEVQSFFSKYPNLGLSARERSIVLNTITSNIAWMASRMKEVERFLLCGSDQCPFTEFRLNRAVQPTFYDLNIKVDLEEDKFSGNVQIEVHVTEAVHFLYLHASSSLQITNSQVMMQDKNVEILRNFSYPAYEFWVLQLNTPVKDEIKLKFEFNSKLATDMYGFYRSEYYNPVTGLSTKLASTQFQDVYARRALPCFDEPSFKANFSVTIEHHKNYIATLSNTKESVSLKADNDMVKTTFATTPEMVTYLLAFMVSDFEHIQAQVSIPEVRVWASPPEKEKTQYTASISPNLIKAFETKFDYNYQLSKMDLVAIPDFSAGAMENWGLLTFRETALLYDEDESAASDKMYVASVVAHEIAHMWFGNLVTCEWWSDLWLNEAFASFFEWFSVNEIEPDWNYLQIFYITDYIPGMNADSSGTSHPLVRTVNSPTEVPYISNIIYQKGSSILRMFQSVFKDQFYTLLQDYLKEREYQTSNSQYLIEALEKGDVANLNLTKFLRDWTMQAGFPYLTLTKNPGSNNYTVMQQRFFANGSSLSNTQTWTVPLTYYLDFSSDTEQKTIYVEDKEETFVINDGNVSLPVKFNVDSLGFYIVNYPVDEWMRWAELFGDAKALSSFKLTPQDYSHLLYDAFTLAKGNVLPYSVAMQLTILLRHNQMFSVWSTGSTIFSQLWPYFRTTDQSGLNQLMQQEFRTYATNLVTDVYVKFSLQGQDPTDLTEQRLRTTVTAFACAYGLDLCLAEAQVEFKKWRLIPDTKLSPNVISTVLRYAIQESNDPSDWHFLWTKYRQSHSTVLKLKYLQGLAQTSNKQLLNLLLDYANDQSVVRAQDYLSLYNYVLRTPIGFEVAWSYFQANYTMIRTKLSSSRMGTLANYFATYFYSGQQRSDFARFFTDHPDHGISATNLQKAYETIDNNIKWASSYRREVFDWFSTMNQSPVTSRQP